MKNTLSDVEKIKECLNDAAFLVIKGDSEREAHGKILESLVILSKVESQLIDIVPDSISSNRGDKMRHYSQHRTHPAPINEKDKEHQEVEKVTRKLPKWFRNKNQINSQILIAYLELSKQNELVNLQQLKAHCSAVKDFNGNYNQMKNFGEKNHGKIFEEKDGSVFLWKPVEDLIYKLYKQSCTQ